MKQLSNEYYDRTLDRLMGEFNLGDRKRGVSGRRVNQCTRSASNFDFENGWSMHTRSLYENKNVGINGSGVCGNGGGSAVIGDVGTGSQQTDDVKDVNFWTSVFFNNGSAMVSSSDLVKSLYSPAASTATISSTTSTSTTAAGDRKLIKKATNPTTPSTYLLNNIISNAKNNRSKVIVNANKSDRDQMFGDDINVSNSVDPSSPSSSVVGSFAFLNTIKPRDLLPKRKNTFDAENGLSSSHQAGELDYQTDIGSERDNNVHKSLNSGNNGDFLQVCLGFFYLF